LSNCFCRSLLLIASAAPAQTFIVDAANGPGTNFTSIVAAVAAVPDGATLIVRPGTYSSFSIVTKGLTILGDTGVQAGGASVRLTQPQQAVVLRGLTFDGHGVFGQYEVVIVDGCSGPVLIEDCNYFLSVYYGGNYPYSISISSSAQVMLRRGSWINCLLGSSNVVIEEANISGQDGSSQPFQVRPSRTAIGIGGGAVQIAGGTLRGGAGWFGLSDSPAIDMFGGTLRLLASTTLIAGTDPVALAPPVAAITGSGTVRIDPQVVLQTSVVPPIASTIGVQTLSMPSLRSTSAPLGGAITASALGPVGDLAILVLGLTGPPVSVPGIADTIWLDPSLYLFAAVGSPQVGVPVTGSVAVPSQPAYLGFPVGWQSISYNVASGLQASNPSWALVR